ncbi:thioredoxin-like fold domain-containing protein MRL7L, chloroplastic [Aristolochia californica]|uniref:thioredoxin-like fold domain-containing protein MRL7L, chloroplastic n=1 Tax=Aristolochia californica TaxID=171875 RepID=UPI0035DA52FB
MAVQCSVKFQFLNLNSNEQHKFHRRKTTTSVHLLRWSSKALEICPQKTSRVNCGSYSPRDASGGISSKFPMLKASNTELNASEVHGSSREKQEEAKTFKSDYQSENDNRADPSKAKVKGQTKKDEDEEPLQMTDEERWDLRRQIREVIDRHPDVEEEMDPVEKTKKMEKLLADYPLVVDEEDPDWPEDADGQGFNLDQFFNKITIKNVRKDDDAYDSDKELVWQDDDYIRAVKDITTNEWEETVFKDISPLVVLVHNRYKRPRENEKIRENLEKGVQIFWDSRLPSPRCVAIDAVVETDLVAALKVSSFPELIFTKAGKILYREKAIRTADELSRIMAFFYYGANRPLWFNVRLEDGQEQIPSLT